MPTSRWRLSLSAQLWLMVTTAALLCGALIAVNLHSDMQRDRKGAADALRQHAKQSVAYITPEVVPDNDTEHTLGNLSDTPALTQLGEPCRQTLAGLQRAVSYGYLEVVDATGAVLCSPKPAHQKGRPWAGEGDLLRAVSARTPLTGGPMRDPWSHELSVFTVVPLKTTRATSLLYVSDTQSSFVPDDKDPLVETLMVDARTMTVVMRFPAPDGVVGTRLTGAGLVRSVRTNGVTSSTGVDGVRRLYLGQALGQSPFRLLVGESEQQAFEAANSSLRRNLLLGGLLVIVVGALGLVLQRQIAKPTRRLRRAIDAAATDATALAPESGPAELAALGASFNTMLRARRQHEAELAHRAVHDPLTGLPNRTAITARLDELISHGKPAAALFLDLDRFKLVNDSHGHAVGDELLIALAGRLTQVVRPGDVVGRFGGDEFVVAVPDITGNAAALELAERVRQVLAEPLRVAGRELFVSGSVGVAVHNGAENAQAVLRNADTAMYRAKARGRNRAEVFDDAMREAAVVQLQTQSDLHRALERDQLSVLFQPLVDLGTGHVLGAEALVRWHHPEHGLISPAQFIPVAEETGLVVPIGGWVMREACSWAVRTAEAAGRPVSIAVNVSSRQLAQPDFPEVVADALTTTGLAPTCCAWR